MEEDGEGDGIRVKDRVNSPAILTALRGEGCGVGVSHLCSVNEGWRGSY